MAFARLSFVLALFCGIASASWGPTNLTAHIDSNRGDFVDIDVTWEAGVCPIAHFKLYSEAPGHPRIEEASTTNVHHLLVNKEFWTTYTLTLETSWCGWDEKPRRTQIFTGPGNPHKVTSVRAASGALVANVTITEAFMPKPVDLYSVTWCSPISCETQPFGRNTRGGAATFNLTLRELQPRTSYNLSVVPEISFGGKPFRGSEFVTKFITKDIQLPVPTDVDVSFLWDEEKQQEVELTWELEDTRYQLAYYSVNISDEADPTFKRSKNVPTPEAIFEDMPNSATLTALITPIFNISRNLIHRDGAVATFTTPHPAPEPKNFTFVALSPESVFAEWITIPELPGRVLSFNFTYTDPENNTESVSVNGTSILVQKLAANTTYEVVITLVSELEHALTQPRQLEAEFSTPAEDFAPPADVKIEELGELTQGESFNLTWTAVDDPEKASRFRIDACHRDTKECTRSETKETQMVLPLNFFGNFLLTVSAVYDLELNQTQIRPAKPLIVETPGVEPLEVTNITAKNVTATDALLVWTAPANIPENISRNYKIFDAESNLIDQTKTEQIQLSKLYAFNEYTVNIEATVRYNNTAFTGNKTSFKFYTDSAAPGAPETVDVEQIIRTNLFGVSWKPPREENGELNYYEVLTKNEAGNVVSNLTNLVGTKGITVPLPSAHGDARYNVYVRAVNVNNKGKALPGNFTESVLSFKGIGTPTAEVVKRSSSSLTFKVTPSNETQDVTGLFYIITNGESVISSPSDNIELRDLKAYTNQTVEVRACYPPAFCSEAFTITELTNVAGPSPVNDLKGDFTNRTVPFINWTAPTHLNGPLDGYLLNLKDLSNNSVDLNEVLPADQTSYVYETSMEFEKYTFTVSGFNNDLDNKGVRVVGALSSTSINTTGLHPPKPENVHQVNKTSTSFSIEWEKPQYADFNVTYYHVVVASLGMDKLTNETEVTVSGLKPWTKTKVETSGCTDDNVTTCGLPGSYSLWTGASNPSQPHSIAFTNVTETEAVVSWAAPLTPNGPIAGYKIAVSLADNQNLTWDEVTEGAVTHHFSNLTANTKYTVHVLAFNVDENTGEELPSPPSIESFSTAGSGGFAWWIIAVALIVIAAAVAIGTVLYKRKNSQPGDREQLVQA